MKYGLDINSQFRKALEIIENTYSNVFVTGRAGTGKSTLLEYFRETTTKNIVVLAPTGVAALNVGGETIHSFFKFKIGITPSQIKKVKNNSIYKSIDAIVIDEVSMVRSDLLDCIDVFMRKNGKCTDLPFGGVQMIFFGDLYQLPPVVTKDEHEIFRTFYKSPYFFDSHALDKTMMEFIELGKVYRQRDQSFIDILDGIRSNTLKEEQYNVLNSRLGVEFADSHSKYSIYLTTTNKMADGINSEQIERINKKKWTFTAVTEGTIDKKYFPTAFELEIKVGSQVMMLNNDINGRWVNGSLAEVVGVEFDQERQCYAIGIELEDGLVEEVIPYKWEIFKYSYDKNDNSVHAEPVGIFVQYPMKLAWAVTIHKSQGKTFDNVVIDIGYGTFAHGQAYVALSRCRSLEGIALKRPFHKRHIMMDNRILEFLMNFKYNRASK